MIKSQDTQKNIKNFEKFFNIAVVNSKIRIDTKFFTYLDLYNHCYIVYLRSKVCNNPKSYSAYVVQRLTGAILDYLKDTFKIRKGERKPSYLNNLSIETPIKDGNQITVGDTLKSTQTYEKMEARFIINEVIQNKSLLLKREKEFFEYYYIKDLDQASVSVIMKVTLCRISQLNTSVKRKLKTYYECTN